MYTSCAKHCLPILSIEIVFPFESCERVPDTSAELLYAFNDKDEESQNIILVDISV